MKYRAKTLAKTENVLTEWGIWARGLGAGRLGYKSFAAVVMQSPAADSTKTCSMPDDVMQLVDEVVAALKQRYPELFQVAYLSFVCDYNILMIKDKLKLPGKQTVSNMLASAIAWIDAKLDDVVRLVK